MADHHPTPELLTAFAAGSLPLSHALCVATHIEHCPLCQNQLDGLDQVGSEMMQQLKPAPASEQLKNRILDQLDQMPTNDNMHSMAAKPRGDNRVPRALKQFVPEDFNSLRWRRIAPTVEAIKLCIDTNGAKVELLRIKPGASIPTHTHTGDEYTVLLQGSFSDESGIYKQHDFIVRDGRHKHRPVVTKDQTCICLAVTDTPIEFTGFFSRWLNPIMRRSHLA